MPPKKGSKPKGISQVKVPGGKEDGAKKDGAKKDGAKKDGAKKDGAKKDGGKEDGGKEDGGKEDGGKEDGGKEDRGKEDGGKEGGAKEDGGKEGGAKEDDDYDIKKDDDKDEKYIDDNNGEGGVKDNEEDVVATCNEEDTPRDAAEEDTPRDAAEEYTPRDAAEEDTPRDAAEEDTPRDAAEEDTPRDAAEEDTPRDAAEEDTPRDAAEKDTPRDAAEEDTPRDAAATTDPIELPPPGIKTGATSKCPGTAPLAMKKHKTSIMIYPENQDLTSPTFTYPDTRSAPHGHTHMSSGMSLEEQGFVPPKATPGTPAKDLFPLGPEIIIHDTESPEFIKISKRSMQEAVEIDSSMKQASTPPGTVASQDRPPQFSGLFPPEHAGVALGTPSQGLAQIPHGTLEGGQAPTASGTITARKAPLKIGMETGYVPSSQEIPSTESLLSPGSFKISHARQPSPEAITTGYAPSHGILKTGHKPPPSLGSITFKHGLQWSPKVATTKLAPPSLETFTVENELPQSSGTITTGHDPSTEIITTGHKQLLSPGTITAEHTPLLPGNFTAGHEPQTGVFTMGHELQPSSGSFTMGHELQPSSGSFIMGHEIQPTSGSFTMGQELQPSSGSFTMGHAPSSGVFTVGNAPQTGLFTTGHATQTGVFTRDGAPQLFQGTTYAVPGPSLPPGQYTSSDGNTYVVMGAEHPGVQVHINDPADDDGEPSFIKKMMMRVEKVETTTTWTEMSYLKVAFSDVIVIPELMYVPKFLRLYTACLYTFFLEIVYIVFAVILSPLLAVLYGVVFGIVAFFGVWVFGPVFRVYKSALGMIYRVLEVCCFTILAPLTSTLGMCLSNIFIQYQKMVDDPEEISELGFKLI